MEKSLDSAYVNLSSEPLSSSRQQPKELKFVTNYGAPHPKRRRIGAACLTCRKRKTACSGERPYCETCTQNNLECAGYSADGAASTHRRANSDSNNRDEKERDSPSRPLMTSHSVTPAKKARKEDGNPPPTSMPADNSSTDTATGVEVHSSTFEPVQIAEQPPKPLFDGLRNRMPYFRWLGPTAIMPGFKQMVVKVKRNQDAERARSSTDGGVISPPTNTKNPGDQRSSSMYSITPAAVESDLRTPLDFPFYDTSPMPPSELITHLANTFFAHLGCNYPFLQRERFLRDLEEKQVDAILVDAVCALAARFSTHALLKQQYHDENKLTPAEYGHAFANRAKTAIVDTFACPSVAAVQAALLLAYNEFGEGRDSGLWMYLGISIRMAQDLGMHKLEGLKYKGMIGPTPKMVKRESRVGSSISKFATQANEKATVPSLAMDDESEDSKAVREQKAVEQERVDTFWAVFFLDRVVSSGTGRRSTLRDKDIEISFPSLDEKDEKTGWPAPFPALIRIVHLYGRVADLLNSFKELADITTDTPKRLAAMENQVTQFYQGLSARLHFDAVSFQHYMKAGEGTNFVLLHFWFHTLIVLLHQPTLLKTFEGRILQLFPNSQQLAMSSAKTIADILSYSQLMDAKASLGNPFTTQPIYIAACAFLKETAEQTASSNAQSRCSTPSRNRDSAPSTTNGTPRSTKKTSGSGSSTGKRTPTSTTDHRNIAKHTLLATAASQHYQLCYRALQSLETYWSGTKYILTILDQKFQGVEDPLLYTTEEGEASMERPRPEPAFTSPGWRRKLSWGQYLPSNFEAMVGMGLRKPLIMANSPGNPIVDPNQAIGWTLTGTMNSPSTNLAWHYPGSNPAMASQQGFMHFGQIGGACGVNGQGHDMYTQHIRADSSNSQRASRSNITNFLNGETPSTNSNGGFGPSSTLPGLNTPYSATPSTTGSGTVMGSYSQPFPTSGAGISSDTGVLTEFAVEPYVDPDGRPINLNFRDMMIESQDVDMSMLGLDMMPWFDSYSAMAIFDTPLQDHNIGQTGEGGGDS
ncbi:Hypothetical protein R9X50_00642000 [Acrodontium crateriforme]|uniref:Zn(2)-C6 fungal-type domain-containing protein n=1 Tax=Acrodontium crateriforme TaxID=150365 RepID=A0AAQ3RC57_9PEZI|nr:Hypothetical protein R9X50_00642000 [Acrodontium crateriforme]